MSILSRLKEPRQEYYTVNLTEFLKRKPRSLRDIKSGCPDRISQFHCPHCKTPIDSVPLKGEATCFLCGLEMQRTSVYRIRCKK